MPGCSVPSLQSLSAYPYTADNQVGDLDAVITQLGLGQVVLVAHDASGPPAIDWSLTHPKRVAGLVLLNTYYCEMPTLRPRRPMTLPSLDSRVPNWRTMPMSLLIASLF
jgi:pimeloyl-ACP methyl ester carboxylesterase